VDRVDPSDQHGDGRPDAVARARAAILGQLQAGDVPAALDAARHLPDMRPDAVDTLVDIALDVARVDLARGVLATTEATIPAAQAAHIKARIAVHEGELATAKAILVVAIERHPDEVVLRRLLTEVMVAAGTAADARAVLTHIGQPPVNPPAPGSQAAPAAQAEAPDKRIG